MQNSKHLVPRWLKRVIFIVLPLILLLVLAGDYVIDYYAEALTKAGSWPITGTPADIGLAYE
jgi:hypothetical protein